jgi:putative Mn2+ efflux pump MntP
MTHILSLLLLAFGLAADAFAVSLAQGAAVRVNPWRTSIRCGVAFGAAQGIAPLIGWSLGVLFAGAIEAFDHWIAFALLALIGGKMLYEGWHARGERQEDIAPGTRERTATGWALMALAVATSIDAVAAGFTLPTLGVPIAISAATIAAITFATSAAGVWIGRLGARSLGWKAELLGGIVLLGIGVNVLFDHHAFG